MRILTSLAVICPQMKFQVISVSGFRTTFEEYIFRCTWTFKSKKTLVCYKCNKQKMQLRIWAVQPTFLTKSSLTFHQLHTYARVHNKNLKSDSPKAVFVLKFNISFLVFQTTQCNQVTKDVKPKSIKIISLINNGAKIIWEMSSCIVQFRLK